MANERLYVVIPSVIPDIFNRESSVAIMANEHLYIVTPLSFPTSLIGNPV